MMDLEGLFQDDIVQCMRLVSAVLTRTIKDLQAKTGGCLGGSKDIDRYLELNRLRAEEYIFSDEVHEFSFLFICDILDVDPKAIRRACLDRSILDWQVSTMTGDGAQFEYYKLQKAA